MGVSVYYKGTLTDMDALLRLVDEIRDICQIMKWEYHTLNDDWTEPVEVSLERKDGGLKIGGNLGLKGIGFKPHPASECVDFYFDSDGNLDAPAYRALRLQKGETNSEETFVCIKTQFAPANIHVAVIKLLKYLKEHYIHDLEVIDEGEYWETGSLEKLEYHRNVINEGLDVLEKVLTDTPRKPGLSSEEYEGYISDVIRKVFDKNRDSK